MAPEMRMEMELRPAPEQEQTLSLNMLGADDQEKLLLAQKLWETKPHITVRLPIAILEGVVAESLQGKVAPQPGLNRAGALVEEFAFISKKDMSSLDDGEKIGIKLGDCVFVAMGTPEDYVPLVVLNLAMHRHLRDDNPLSALLEQSGIDFAHSRHWTANIFDVLLAERFFEEQSGEFDNYLEWRKSVERTECFSNELVDKILRGRISKSEYRKNTHPLDRGGYVRHSWRLSHCLDNIFSASQTDSLYRNLGVSKCDLLFNRMLKHLEFDPNKMMQLLRLLCDESVTENGAHKKVTVGTDLDSQANLFTEHVAGDAAILEWCEGETYLKKNQAIVTARALMDKLTYFFRHAVKPLSVERHELLSRVRGLLSAQTAVQNEDK